MKKEKGLVIFVIAGRIGTSLTVSKVAPIIRLNRVEKVIIFRREKGPPLEKTQYVTLPKFITFLRPYFIYFMFRTFFEIFQLLIFSIKYQPDVINGIYTSMPGFYSFLVSNLLGVKNIISIIGWRIELKTYHKSSSIWKRFNIWMYRKSTLVTTTGSRVTKYLIENKIEKRKITTYPGSIDTSIFFDANYTREIDIIFAGRFSRLKGPDRVLQVIKYLKSEMEMPDIKGCFLGEGDMFNLIQEEVRKNDLENNVELMGYVKNTEYYFQRAKLILMPSWSEGLSIAMLEAMACGCVPIVSDVGNMTDAARHGWNAIVVNDYLDVKLFAKCARDLLIKRAKWSFLSNNAKKFSFDNYSIKAQSKIFENILNALKL